MQFSITDQ